MMRHVDEAAHGACCQASACCWGLCRLRLAVVVVFDPAGNRYNPLVPREEHMIEVRVTNDQVDRAMRDLKRKLIKEGLFKELSRRKHYVKPSRARRLKRVQAEKMRKKEARRERERLGH